jgi:hypothetical protein
MKHHSPVPRSLLALLGLLAAGFAAPASHAQVTWSTGFDFSTGKYGSTQSTDIMYVPFTGAMRTGAWDLRLTVPWIRVHGPGNVVRDIGSVGGTGAVTTETGLGDIIVSAATDVHRDEVSGFAVGVTGRVKFGTASRGRGLGTGEHDAMLQADVSRPFGSLLPFATLGYRLLGDPPGSALRNGFYGSAGATYALDVRTSVGAAFDLRERTTAGGDGAAEVSAFLTHRVDNTWRVQAYVVGGLSDASPDFGIGGIVSYSF